MLDFAEDGTIESVCSLRNQSTVAPHQTNTQRSPTPETITATAAVASTLAIRGDAIQSTQSTQVNSTLSISQAVEPLQTSGGVRTTAQISVASLQVETPIENSADATAVPTRQSVSPGSKTSEAACMDPPYIDVGAIVFTAFSPGDLSSDQEAFFGQATASAAAVATTGVCLLAENSFQTSE